MRCAKKGTKIPVVCTKSNLVNAKSSLALRAANRAPFECRRTNRTADQVTAGQKYDTDLDWIEK